MRDGRRPRQRPRRARAPAAALLGQRDGIATALLDGVGVDRLRWPRQAERAVAAMPSASGATVSSADLAQSTYRVLNDAGTWRRRGDEYVSTEHLLIALAARRADRPDPGRGRGDPRGPDHGAGRRARRRRVDSADPEGSFQALEKYGVDLTARAREGKIDPVIGRDAEIRRVIQVLSPAHQEQPRADR